MRKIKASAFVAVCAVLFATLQPNLAAAACGTQGAFALALAQILGYEVTDEGAAIASLANVGVIPAAEWNPEACMTEDVANEIDRDLKNAVGMGIFTSEEVAGVVLLALSSIGEEKIAEAMTRMPNPFIGQRSRVGGPPLEGTRNPESPPPPPPPPPTTTTTSRPPASPFVP